MSVPPSAILFCGVFSARRGVYSSGRSTQAVARAAMPSLRPRKPMDSFVVALMPMRLGCRPSGWGISTPLANGRRNPAASIMLSPLAEMARNEVEVLRERINSGLAQARRKGVVLGRPKGSTVSSDDLLAKHSDIVRLLKQGQSIRHAGKITGKGFSTVQRVKKILDQQQVLLAA